MNFNQYRLKLESYLDRMGLADATKSDYLRLFNKLEKAHKAQHFASPNQELSEVFASKLLSLLQLSGYTSNSLRRTSQILSSIRAVFDNCSYEEFYRLIRHKKLPSLDSEILKTLHGFRKTLSDKRLEDETIQSNVRIVLLFLDEAKVKNLNDLTNLSAQSVVRVIVSIMTSRAPSFFKKLGAIRAYLHWLYQHKLISQDLSKCIYLRTPKTQPLIRLFPPEALNKLISNLDDSSDELIQLKAIIHLALFTGLRGVDLARLKVTDLDWKDRTISVAQSKTKVCITLPLTDATAIPLAKYLLEVRPEHAKTYVFCNISTGLKLSRRDISDLFRKYRDRILGNTFKGYGIHALRRTLGSCLFQEECDTHLIREILGHSDMSSLDRYMQADDKHLRLCNLELVGETLRGELMDG